jgi:hypothetical protein
MSETQNYTLHYLGWCLDPAENHDKIWGFIEMHNARAPKDRWDKPRGSLYNFWGKRGKTLSWQRHYGEWGGGSELEQRQRNKARRKGYKEFPESRVNEVWPNFKDYLAEQFVLAKFGGKIKDDMLDDNFV